MPNCSARSRNWRASWRNTTLKRTAQRPARKRPPNSRDDQSRRLLYGKLRPRRLLEKPQTELRYNRQQVIEDICLDIFILTPGRRGCKTVDLNGYTLRPR